MSEKIKKDRREFLAQAGAIVVGTMVAGNAMALTANPAKSVAKKAALPSGGRKSAMIKTMIEKKGLVLPRADLKQLQSPFSNNVVDRIDIVTGELVVQGDIKILAETIKADITAGKYDVASVAAVLADLAVIMDTAVAGSESESRGYGCGSGCPDAEGMNCGDDCGGGGGTGVPEGDGCVNPSEVGGNSTSQPETNGDCCGNTCGGGCGSSCGSNCSEMGSEIATGYDSFLQSLFRDMHGLDLYTAEVIQYNSALIMNELVAR